MSEYSKSSNEVTKLLIRQDLSADEKYKRLMSLVYFELKSIAINKMGHERHNHTLTPTALVHEAYLRLVRDANLSWHSRKHFFAVAAESMRRILIESARRKLAKKHGFNIQHTNNLELAKSDDKNQETQIIDLDHCLTQLESLDAQMANVVKLRYFSGLTIAETALALGISARSVNRLWTNARAWLIAHM